MTAACGPNGVDTALAFTGIRKRFRTGQGTVDALDGVDLTARRGQVTGLIGPDGAGKTTLLRVAAGLLVPESGGVSVLGRDAVEEPGAVQAIVGYMPQRFGLYEDLTVTENLNLYADLRGLAVSQRGGRFGELSRMTGLGPFQDRLAGRLSGGMKQKLGLACALLTTPPLLLLDEPTVGVDPLSRRELWQIIYRMVGEGTTVLLSTSYLDEAARCDTVALMHHGRVLGCGTAREFTEPLGNRSFHVRSTRVGKRPLQRQMARTPGVADAVIQRDGVRVVVEEGRSPTEFGDDPDLHWEAVAPRFEDAFITLIGHPRPSGTVFRASRAAAADRGKEVITARDLSRRFGDFYAVREVSFDVRRGEVFGLLGANGAGKSTTFRMLCGLLPASSGDIRVAGVDLRRAPADARARIGYMSQRFSLYGQLTVRQNLQFFASAYGLAGTRKRERIGWALEEFDLVHHGGDDAGNLPLGYKQRLALAAALMHTPDILFLDEPTSGVDPLARREFWDRINGLAEGGVTVLVTTHFLEEAEYCDRAAIMVAGRILQIGSPESIKAAARSPEHPDPDMEEAFISVIQSAEAKGTGARDE